MPMVMGSSLCGVWNASAQACRYGETQCISFKMTWEIIGGASIRATFLPNSLVVRLCLNGTMWRIYWCKVISSISLTQEALLCCTVYLIQIYCIVCKSKVSSMPPPAGSNSEFSSELSVLGMFTKDPRIEVCSPGHSSLIGQGGSAFIVH